VNSRVFEVASIAAIMLVLLLGGRAWIVDVAQFHGIAVSVLVLIGVVIVYAFRRNYLAGGPLVRMYASRDAAFLAAIISAIAFVIWPAKWSLGATISAAEFGLVIELLTRLRQAPADNTSA
jgi:hypothetical protein